MVRSKKSCVEVHLGYFKQGDDLAHCLRETKTPEAAFKMHAEIMRSVAEHLDKVAVLVAKHKVEVQADTHMIQICCDKKLANTLIKASLAEKYPEEDE
jgi:2-phospho-L-lactate guanylyltransferase (CobY/MobA/RfbA family)